MACWRAADWRWRNICYNMPVQGTGADLLKMTLIDLIDGAGEYYNVFATVHDSRDAYVKKGYAEELRAAIDAIDLKAAAALLPGITIKGEHSLGRCWASAPPDIRTADHGLWVYPKGLTDEELAAWVKTEFQQELL